MPRIFAALLIAVSLAACKSHPEVAAPPPVIHSIAIIPASNPQWFTFENATPPVGYPFQFWVNKLDSHGKAKRFNDAMDAPGEKLGDAITQEIAGKLREHGFSVEILDHVARTPDNPDDVDYDKIKTTADAVLHVKLWEVGMWSSHLSTKYIPRINASGKLWANGREDDIYMEDVYYGVDAKKGKDWAIVPDEKLRYGSFDEVMSHLPEIRGSFESGVQLVGERLAAQIIASVRPFESVAAGTP